MNFTYETNCITVYLRYNTAVQEIFNDILNVMFTKSVNIYILWSYFVNEKLYTLIRLKVFFCFKFEYMEESFLHLTVLSKCIRWSDIEGEITVENFENFIVRTMEFWESNDNVEF